ncbi:MAG: PD40 domain-containing protein [Candidatus Schekmanbacteria bacterium]|nr:PD40 domain-containing protein [Candidatus Schekmanbacteria bacterium]
MPVPSKDGVGRRRLGGIAVRLLVAAGCSLLILAALLGQLTAGEAGAELPRLVSLVTAPAWSFVLAYLACTLAQTALRGARYGVLLRAAGAAAVPARGWLFLVAAIRNMLIDLVPARLGELGYVALLNRGLAVGAAACLSSLAISFLFDVAALVALLLPCIAAQFLAGTGALWMIAGGSVLAAGASVAALLLFGGAPLAARLIERHRRARDRDHAPRYVTALVTISGELARALETTRKAGVTGRVFALSIGVRSCKYLGLYAALSAITVPHFPALAKVPLAQTVFAFVGAESFAALPVPALFGFGPYEAGSTLVLGLLGFSVAEAALAMTAAHVWTQLCDYGLGLVALAGFIALVRRPPVALAAPAAAAPMPASRRSGARLAAAVLVLVCGAAGLGWELLASRKLGALSPPAPGADLDLSSADAARLRTLLGGVRGFLVWSSNRFGNHDIIRLTLPHLELRRMTTDPHADTFPRISPDGARVVFARSQEVWVSQRNYLAWDVWQLDLATGVERLVARHGNAPTWSEDGRSILFQRGGNTVVQSDLATGTETVLFSPVLDGLPAGVMLETPSFSSRRNALAVTLRKAERATAVIDAAPRRGQQPVRRLGQGCQLTWSPDGGFLYFVDEGGRQRNAIFTRDPASPERRLWLDLPGEHSHEYFPRLANDGRYLVFAASAAGHEHDTADYEIFVWRVGDDAADAVRVSYHSGNDCWPDLYVRGAG